MDDRLVFPTIPWALGTPAGVRTLDTLIKSQVLYQLSYGCMLGVYVMNFMKSCHKYVMNYIKYVMIVGVWLQR